MEKLILTKRAQEQKASATPGGVPPLKQTPPQELAQEKKLMRQPRSRKYIKALQEAVNLQSSDEQVVTAVEALPVKNKLLGILSECGITGCIIHAIDKWGNILAHYRSVAEIPADMQGGYDIYMRHPGCISVEVYTYTYCVIYNDGTVKFIERVE